MNIRLLITMMSAAAVMGCGTSNKSIFLERFEDTPIGSTPSATPDVGKSISISEAQLVKVKTFPPHLDDKCMGFDQPKDGVPAFKRVEFVANQSPAGYDDGYRVIWLGYYKNIHNGGIAVSLQSGHFITAFTMILKSGNVFVIENNQEKLVGSYSQSHNHTVICTVQKGTGTYSLGVLSGDGVTQTSYEAPLQMPNFWNSDELYLGIVWQTNAPQNASQVDTYAMSEANIVALKKN